ncbi:Cys-tRNA(Pro) deacylase [Bacillus marinisedimentorum]|uniref:Cys-tRNA(Pro) deacylase n=1 Tax=Bacillus marinisedimentorum TaxID=1821260 RepID=UPI000871CE30|nr:Cys-tRNA(Pro) deacylase [Bacillus marinisedimentorum]
MANRPKTNAMRLLEANRIDYRILSYDKTDGKIDGVSVAGKIGKDPASVYKTLVCRGTSGELYVFVIPVAAELDMKKAAKASGEKKMEMIPVKDIQKLTGYVRGGCSPVGMKKQYATYIDKRAESLENIIVSAGKVGLQVEISPASLCGVTNAILLELVK